MLPQGAAAITNALKRSRQTGTLNLQNQGIQDFPEDIVNLSELTFGEKWWDCVPLQRLDMTNNELTQINGQLFEKERDIVLVRFINNKIQEIPIQLFTLELLKSIDFTHNKIQQIPQQIALCQSLVEIQLADNNIQDIPNQLNQLQNLESLNLSCNRLQMFPNLSGLKKLKFLFLQENQIQNINPQSLQGLLSLEQLNLQKNQISNFQQQYLQDCQNLVLLQLDQNKLEKLNLPELPRLDQVSASYNRILSFEDFDNIRNLTAFVLSNNKLKQLSRNILLCKNMTTLDIGNNDLGDIPSEIGCLPKLVRIILEGNPLKCIRSTIKQAGAEQLKTYLKSRIEGDLSKLEEQFDPKLKFTNQQIDQWEMLLREFCQNNEFICRQQNLSTIDERVFQIDLKILDLQQNNISQIPQNIGTLLNMQKLNLAKNKIQIIPQEILRLQNLQQIELQNNQISQFFSDIPLQYVQFQKLQYLDLSINNLQQVPQCILQMKSLSTLILAYNKIQNVDMLFSEKLSQLKTLDVSNNRIQSLTDQIAYNQPDLQFLNFSNNDLGQIPSIMGFMRLKGLQIDGNPLKLIKRTVIDKGTVHILEYLKTRHPDPNPQGLAWQNKQQVQYQQQRQVEDQQNYMEQQIDSGYQNQQQYPQTYQPPRQQQQQNSNYQYQNPYQQQQQPQQQPQQYQYGQGQQYQNNNQQQQAFNNQSQYINQNNPYQQQQQQSFQQQQPQQFQQQQQQQQQQQRNPQQIQQELQSVNSQIKQLESDINDNFQLNRFQKNEKRKQLQLLMVKRSELTKQL